MQPKRRTECDESMQGTGKNGIDQYYSEKQSFHRRAERSATKVRDQKRQKFKLHPSVLPPGLAKITIFKQSIAVANNKQRNFSHFFPKLFLTLFLHFNYSRNADNKTMQVRMGYLKMLEDRLKQLDAERQLFPQQILAKLKEVDDHLNGIVRKNQQLYESVRILSDERQILLNEIEIMRKLCADHDEMARKYMRAKRVNHTMMTEFDDLMTELNSYRSIEQNPMVSFANSAVHRQRKPPSFKSIALAVVAIMRMKINVTKKYSMVADGSVRV